VDEDEEDEAEMGELEEEARESLHHEEEPDHPVLTSFT